MIIFGTCVGNEERYRAVALPSIERVAGTEDLIWSRSGERGIGAAYNEMILAARDVAACQALVVLHEDVQIVDDNFRPKLLKSLGHNVGLVGVVGASRLKGLAWWDARCAAGLVYETRGVIDFSTRRADVDAVDGLLMALAPSAFRTMLFDGDSFPAFHGYDIDYCIQARDAGLRVLVTDIDVLHRTKGGYGDRVAYNAAEAALIEKWPNWIRPSRVPPFISSFVARARTIPPRFHRTSLRQVAVRSRRLIIRGSERLRRRDQATTSSSAIESVRGEGTCSCPVCGTLLTSPPAQVSKVVIVECPDCGTGVTWPPPSGDVESAALFKKSYGDMRLDQRSTRMNEARSRVGWLQLYIPDGSILELGCTTGEFLSLAGDSGYEVYGVETSAWAAYEARKLGGEVVTGYLEDWRREYPGFRVDGVVMWHALEHMPHPLQLIHEIADVLKPNGRLVVEVANFASSQAKIDGTAWENASLNEHYFHYTPEGLVVLLRSAGLEPTEVLPFASRVYRSKEGWREQRNKAFLEAAPWPSLDVLRVVARKSPV